FWPGDGFRIPYSLPRAIRNLEGGLGRLLFCTAESCWRGAAGASLSSGPVLRRYDGAMDNGTHQRLDVLLQQARKRIDAEDALILLAYVLSKTPAWLYAHGDATV